MPFVSLPYDMLSDTLCLVLFMELLCYQYFSRFPQPRQDDWDITSTTVMTVTIAMNQELLFPTKGISLIIVLAGYLVE